MLLPGSTLGMLGGGQLGRVFALSARSLGYKVIVVEPDPTSPAGQVADEHIIAAYDDEKALEQLGKACDVITTEFENIPADVLRKLSESCPVYPPADALEKAQDRIVEKAFILSCGLLPVPYGVITTKSDIAKAVSEITFPAILKTARFGYDGKGQQTINSAEDVEAAFMATNQVDCVLEQRIDLDCEISVILGRNESGESQCFPVAENIHVDGILHQTLVPANISDDLTKSAQAAAVRMADKLGYVGVIAVEFFVTKKGELLVNEMAPRTHNSGHYTVDACVTSQFEQQVRMVCDLPFGDSRLLSPVVMTNLLGDVWGDETQIENGSQPKWQELLQSGSSKLHLYGKHEARIGRKMGHFCTLADDLEQAKVEANSVFSKLSS
jgi:5-(carboxyamino)imidazole ribonucleotide synthase